MAFNSISNIVCIFFKFASIKIPVRLVDSDVTGGESNAASTQTQVLCA